MPETPLPPPHALPLRDWPDDALLAAAAHGERRDAFEVLLDRHETPLLGFLVRRVGEHAEDLGQEVFLKAFAAARRGRGPTAAFRPWLYAIARNAAADGHRRRGRRIGSAPVDGGRPREAPAAERPDRRAERNEERAAAEAALAALPESTREAIELRVYGDLTYAEIAGLTGEPTTTVKSRVTRALAALRRRLADRNDNPSNGSR